MSRPDRRRLADVVLVGPVTPPVGGVAVHIERWAALLEAKGYVVTIFNHFAGTSHPLVTAALNRNPLRYYWRLRRPPGRVVHYHHSRWWTLVATSAARPRSRPGTWIATFHGYEIDSALRSANPAIRFSVRRAIDQFDHLVAVSVGLAGAIEAQTGHRPQVAPAYLPYVADERAAAQDDSPSSTGRRLIVSAYRVANAAPEDTYGLDIAVESFLRIARERDDVSMELYLSQPPRTADARRYLGHLRGRLAAGGVESRFEHYVGKAMPPAFAPGAIYLRPSRSDGDAVSIREAIAAGIPVLASDAVSRPEGTQVLPQDSVEAWTSAIVSTLEGEALSPRPLPDESLGSTQLLELYGPPDSDTTGPRPGAQ